MSVLDEDTLLRVKAATRLAIKQGTLIEGGYQKLVDILAKGLGPPPESIQGILRLFFFMGANHLMSSMDFVFDSEDEDPSNEPNSGEETRFELVNAELGKFLRENFEEMPDGRLRMYLETQK